MHLLFDLDGTLTDPAPGIVACLEHALHAMGVPVPERDFTSFIGPPLKETFGDLLGTADADEIERAIEHYRERFVEVGLFENAVFPGIPAVLETLVDAGHELRVATSKPHVYAERIIDHFDLRRHFTHVYGSELSGVRTDKGDLIRHVLDVESLPGEDTCMIGDRRHDIDGARSQGVRSIGVLWGFGNKAELVAARPDRLVHRIGDLVRAIHDLAA